MITRLRNLFPSFVSSILNSYTQVFFSNNKVFAVILVAVTMFDIYAGITGILAVVISNISAYLIGFNRDNIKAGYYGFNSLLVGLGLGIFYQFGWEFFILLIFAVLLTFFITVMMEGVIGKYGLPFLSIAFLAGIWLVTLASRQFTALSISYRGIYMLNEMYSLAGLPMVKLYDWFNGIPLHESVKIYFKSLGAILFQYHLVPGLLVAFGLLVYSRIAFFLSLLGFYSAYFYYLFIGANFTELSYGYIGFNYILTSIAIGGFFIIPSRYSYLWIILLTPLVSIILTATNTIFSWFQLSVFSLPFNIIVLLFLYVLKFRERFFSKPEMVGIQQYSPEKNLYSRLNMKDRFGKSYIFPLALPFLGEWITTQGENGEHTHKGEWKNAWDFEIPDENGSTYTKDGKQREDYYCFGKPVTAPADGHVEEVINDVEDNDTGIMNLEQNWGNTIVLRHGDQLYSKLSHLKKNSIKVLPGDAVKKGDVIANCGNSGRSPVPHLHFQIQSTPYIGSKTLDYPLGHYILHGKDKYTLRSYEKPQKGERVSNIRRNTAMETAFHFIPGQKLNFMVEDEKNKTYSLAWEIKADINNYTYIFCERSRSKAWFRFDGEIHYFTHFEGSKNSVLFYFYLGAFKMLSGFYRDLEIKDIYPLSILHPRSLMFFQDFIAPFWIFMKAEYSLVYEKMEDDFARVNILLRSLTSVKLWARETRKITFEIEVSKKGIERFSITDKNKKTEIKRIS